jgi:beta-lactamase class A
MNFSRRQMMMGATAALIARPTLASGSAVDRLAAVEFGIGGRLGVAALATGTGQRVDFRSDHRWPMCSTFKLLLAGAVLAKVDAGQEQLDRAIAFGKDDLQDYAPAVKKNLGLGKMSVRDLCEAAIRWSDNSAANLLLSTIGGPEEVNSFTRSMDDHVTHLDRIEPFLNVVPPGDARDTTSPAAMLLDMKMLLLHDRLLPASRQLLIDWLVACETGKERLRAGMPAGWRVGDKTGTWSGGSSNDVAVVWPPGRDPLLITAYLANSSASQAEQNKALAEVAKIVADELISRA